MADLTDTFYPAEGAVHGYGSQFLVGDGGSPEGFEAVAEVTEIGFGTMETAKFERTHLRSPDAHREWALALRDSGAFVLKCNWRPRHESQSNLGGGTVAFTAGGMMKFWRDRSTKNYKIVTADGTPPLEVPFRGGITKYQMGTIGKDGGTDLTIEVQPLDGSWHAELP